MSTQRERLLEHRLVSDLAELMLTGLCCASKAADDPKGQLRGSVRLDFYKI